MMGKCSMGKAEFATETNDIVASLIEGNYQQLLQLIRHWQTEHLPLANDLKTTDKSLKDHW